MSDTMDFLTNDDEPKKKNKKEAAWNVMIIDDDDAVHDVTKFALAGFSFQNRPIEWFDAYSAEEAKRLMTEHKDIALIFLDVIMETDNAGLDFAKWLRDQSLSPSTRIILRTGQPGQVPEQQVIVDYDLHDYKTKTELSADKLFTTTVAALRAYNDMHRLDRTKQGLEGIIRVSGTLFQIQSMYEYARSVLAQIGGVLDIKNSGIICFQSKEDKAWEILAETGEFSHSYDQIMTLISQSSENEDADAPDNCLIKVLRPGSDVKYAIYLEPDGGLNEIQSRMLLMFCNNISIGLSNIKLYTSLVNAYKATVMSLAQITEYRDTDTGEHIFRIARGVERLTKALYDRHIYEDEITDRLFEIIGLSATLHDVGKVAMPDNILLKPGRLTPEEFAVIQGHPSVGAKILQAAIENVGENTEYLEIGKKIAQYHHERWDGSGYPEQRAATQIPIEARITAIVDVFDALTNERCYKKAMPAEDALEIIRKGRGAAFDPLITDLFLEIYGDIFS